MTTFMPQFAAGNELMLVVVKFMFVLSGFLYLLFAFLFIKQVALMSKTLKTTASVQNKFFAYIHFAASLLVLIYYLLVL